MTLARYFVKIAFSTYIQHLQVELDANMKRIKQAEKEYEAAEEQLKRMKKEMGWID